MKDDQKKAFVVAIVSSNPNSFGLHGFVLIAKDGEAWEVAGNYLKVKELPVGTVINLQIMPNNEPAFARHGFEILHKLDKAPQGVVDEIWAVPQPA